MSDVADVIAGSAAGVQELQRLGRRDFIATTIGLGFAMAVLPVCAQTMIRTDEKGLTAGIVKLNIGGKEMPVYRAQPEGKKNLPVVLVVSEIFGLHEHIADVARRFAKAGYLALAPDLFVRQGNAASYEDIEELRKNIINKTPDAQVLGDLDDCVAWAAKNGGDANKLGITGFCWGGRIVWLYCAHNSKVKAGVAWYGKLTGNKTANTPEYPLDVAADIEVPVLGLYGAKDNSIPTETIEQMENKLAKGKSGSEFVVYPDAGHAFHADYRPSYVEADAKDGWKRCLAWFKAHGVA